MQVLIQVLKDEGFRIVANGSDNNLCLVDVKSSCNLTGKESETLLDKVNITVNKNTIPFDSERPAFGSGIRLGTAAMTTRGFKEKEFEKVIIPKGKWIVIKINSQEAEDIQEVTNKFYKEFVPSTNYTLKELPELEYYHDDITEFMIPIVSE